MTEKRLSLTCLRYDQVRSVTRRDRSHCPNLFCIISSPYRYLSEIPFASSNPNHLHPPSPPSSVLHLSGANFHPSLQNFQQFRHQSGRTRATSMPRASPKLSSNLLTPIQHPCPLVYPFFGKLPKSASES